MIICLPNNKQSEEDTILNIAEHLYWWTEISLSPTSGYDREKVKYFDGILGKLIRETEKTLKVHPEYEDDEFISSWIYRGKLYRVLHECPHVDRRYSDGYRLDLPKVEYHRMISHWTDDYSFSGLMYKLNPEAKSIILEADSGPHIAFNVNGFRKAFGFENRCVEKEREFIFPMYEECITEYRMSISEFVEMKKKTV